MITAQDLISNGFVKSVYPAMPPGTIALYQKKVEGPFGFCQPGKLQTLYFINVWEWRDNSFNPFITRFSCEARMYVDSQESFDLNFIVDPVHVVEDILGFYRRAYTKLGCCPDLHNN